MLIHISHRLPETADRDVHRHIPVIVVAPTALVNKHARDNHSGDLFGGSNCLSEACGRRNTFPDTSSRERTRSHEYCRYRYMLAKFVTLVRLAFAVAHGIRFLWTVQISAVRFFLYVKALFQTSRRNKCEQST